MRLKTRLLFLCLVVALVVAQEEEEEEEDRDKRQTQPYFTGGLSSHRPTPKPQPFTGGLQTVVSRFPGLGGPPPQGFRSATPIQEEDDEVDRNAVSPTPTPQFRPQPTPQALAYRSPSPSPQPHHQQQQQQQQVVLRSRPAAQEFHSQSARRPQQQQRPQYSPQQQLTEEELEELEEEKEEPDRLTLLLPQSKFSCQAKNTGYYADDGLNCEVFHYCQDNARHSWICPEGFLFHQVHLICMPPSSDNICKQSAQYHFVNDYLYRPINAEEHQNKPNVSLRYADRYYPENYYEEGEESHPAPSSAPVPRPRPQQYQQQLLRPSPTPQQYRQTQNNQVFHSPEEVNIPLQQRRPTSQPNRNYPQSSPQFDF